MIAEELHSLLQAAKIPPPYVIVGHSMGEYDVRVYTSMDRPEIVGMVLVDASHPDQEKRFPPRLKDLEGGGNREIEFFASTMPFGIPRLLGWCESDPVTRAADCNWHSAREQRAEMRAFPRSAAQAAATGSLGDLPLAVLSHDPDRPSSDLPPDLARPSNEAWERMQVELGASLHARNPGHRQEQCTLHSDRSSGGRRRCHSQHPSGKRGKRHPSQKQLPFFRQAADARWLRR